MLIPTNINGFSVYVVCVTFYLVVCSMTVLFNSFELSYT